MKRQLPLLLTLASNIMCAHAADPSPQLQGFTRVTKYHGIDAPTGPLQTALSELVARSTAGDAKAAAQIYAGLVRCRALRANGSPEEASGYCEATTPAQIATAGSYLEMAAKLGDADARYVYVSAGLHEMDLAHTSGRATEINHYKTSAARYLKELSQECNTDAIGRLYSETSKGGYAMKKSPSEAYKFLNVMHLLSLMRVTPEQFRIAEKEIDTRDVFSIRTEADAFVERYCR
ncbi:hypothetical protein EC912_10842 [Luteibacter rhizovicinus]|uniref:Sel1 repeat-containing protein n=1 Tax=Luteibacter rhizovicinus TaxID=242606 RepID=A0A4R3YIV9_9GAMM|nr:hypothetical protein [Luteibacter rhizovicinus]TCV92051.1 hypothetical protein EC912_10842 [Luteibacter rhizovicinus]